MRSSLILLAMLAACSDSSGPRHVPVLATELSASVVSVNDALQVSLHASNPTDTTLHLSYLGTNAEIRLQGQWSTGTGSNDGFGGAGNVDTLSLASGAGAPLGTVDLTFTPQAFVLSGENFNLSPGTYSVRACYFPWAPVSSAGGISQAVCGNTVRLTLTP